MRPDKLAWLATLLRRLESARFTGELRLSYHQGNLHPTIKQVTTLKKT